MTSVEKIEGFDTSTRSVDMSLARRFNAGIRSPTGLVA